MDCASTVWPLLTFLPLLYVVLILTAAPYARPRIPLFVFIFAVFFPPLLLILTLYLLYLYAFVPLREPIVVVRRRPKSRLDLSSTR